MKRKKRRKRRRKRKRERILGQLKHTQEDEGDMKEGKKRMEKMQ